MADRPADGQPSAGSARRDTAADSTAPTASSPPANAQPQPASSYRPVLASPVRPATAINGARSYELPTPQQAAPSTTAPSPAAPPARLAGVSSILNPQWDEEPKTGRRRKASQLDSPVSLNQSLPPIVTSAPFQQTAQSLQAPSPVNQSGGPVEHRPPRRILTPRSPSLHRTASLNNLNPSNGTINAQQSPFPTSPSTRSYSMEPGTNGIPPLPTPPAAAQHRPSYGFPAPTPSTEAARRASTNTRGTRASSLSASPSTTYSSYSQAGQNSPALLNGLVTLTGSSIGPSDDVSQASRTQNGQRTDGIPIASTGSQSVYQMMTLETTVGNVQVPVDVQAASRAADEKRRRNAGASARFRQRRKEKEREASTTIGRLETQIKDLVEQVDFYRRERDFLSGILSHIPGGERHFPRPQSPRQRREATRQEVAANDAGNSVYSTTPQPRSHPPPPYDAPQSPEEQRNDKRRTSGHSLAPMHPPPGPGLPIQQGYGYQSPPPPYDSQQHSFNPQLPSGFQANRGTYHPSQMPVGVPQQPQQQQQQHQQQQQQQPGPPRTMETLPQSSGPYNPYALENRPSGHLGQPRESR